MTYQAEAFKSDFAKVASPNSVNTYMSFLRRIDEAIVGGLDEALATEGAVAVLEWGRTASGPPFDAYRSHARSVLKRYVQFVSGRDSIEIGTEALEEVQEAVASSFGVEREMQAAVRRSLATLEPGLTAADGGIERAVQTGRIDILARDSAGTLTVVELKAGRCPPGTLEQALGYAHSLSEEVGEAVRVIVVASEYSERQLAAAKRISGLRLYSYDYSVTFREERLP